MKFTIKAAISPQDYNNKQTNTGSTLKTFKGSPIKRSNKYGVGKEIGGDIYFHKNYADKIVPMDILSNAKQILQQKYPDFQYNCMRYSPKTGAVSFQECPDFDTAREPKVGDYITVMSDGTVKTGHSEYIFHHKWLWVSDDYTGFDVNQSWEWSRQWLNTLQETSDGNGIGRWNAQLNKYGLPVEGSKVMKITASQQENEVLSAIDALLLKIEELSDYATDIYNAIDKNNGEVRDAQELVYDVDDIIFELKGILSSMGEMANWQQIFKPNRGGRSW